MGSLEIYNTSERRLAAKRELNKDSGDVWYNDQDEGEKWNCLIIFPPTHVAHTAPWGKSRRGIEMGSCGFHSFPWHSAVVSEQASITQRPKLDFIRSHEFLPIEGVQHQSDLSY